MRCDLCLAEATTDTRWVEVQFAFWLVRSFPSKAPLICFYIFGQLSLRSDYNLFRSPHVDCGDVVMIRHIDEESQLATHYLLQWTSIDTLFRKPWRLSKAKSMLVAYRTFRPGNWSSAQTKKCQRCSTSNIRKPGVSLRCTSMVNLCYFPPIPNVLE